MSDQLIFSEPYGVVLVDASVPCVITQWHAFANATEFITLQGFALEYFEAHSSSGNPWGWVGDVRQMGAIPAKAQAWLVAEFNSRATAAGLREVSVVVAETVFGQIATQRYIDETRHNRDRADLHTQVYDSLASAKEGARQSVVRHRATDSHPS
ncbi:hypothetical protein GKZ68_10810 [Hymenobacter sp. BRD128]|uniref:hypothetical protein n=1 Tax=Hymenobacter sp. BRD128 TaxID=2675878 RepID=UPI00156431C7|nr:hypothetical protein [Hymenobacter sp. BRD128]QKG57074.1 hypothetical protein GKZ68_10810 [Hymenobacter sp. BRD128]